MDLQGAEQVSSCCQDSCTSSNPQCACSSSETASPSGNNRTCSSGQAAELGESKQSTGKERPRRFVGRKGNADSSGRSVVRKGGRRAAQQIPDDILNNEALNEAIKVLPSNYNLEVHKIVWRIRETEAKTVALQFPEGLLLFACPLVDILERFCNVLCVVLGDVTYGACCVDDINAKSFGAELLVHFGHSCLVPMTYCCIPVLYIFVDIAIDVDHLVNSIEANFDSSESISVVSTVQFIQSVHALKQKLPGFNLSIPQARPLSKGEILGCTAPTLDGCSKILYVGDGRFHMEAVMIANPSIPTFQYDPYSKRLTKEDYLHDEMKAVRWGQVEVAQKAKCFGVILGTLGRQGNPAIVQNLVTALQDKGKEVHVFLMSEVFPARLGLLDADVDAWVQVACPRLSIDWGRAFKKPLLTPYETYVALEAAEWAATYPMDYYSNSAKPWSNYTSKRGVTLSVEAEA